MPRGADPSSGPGDVGDGTDAAGSRGMGPLLAGVTAPLTAFVGLVAFGLPVVAAWVTAAGSSDDTWTVVLRATGAAWLAAQDVSLRIDGVTVAVAPVGWGLACVGLLIANARWVAHRAGAASPGDVAWIAAAGAAVYGVTAGAVAYAVAGEGIVVSPTRAAVKAAVLAGATLLLAVARASGVRLGSAVRGPWSLVVTSCLRAGTAAAAALVVVGAVVAAVSLGLAFGRVAEATREFAPEPIPALLLTLVSLGYAPVVAAWGTAYALGPGAGSTDGLPGLPILLGAELPIPLWARLAAGVLVGLLVGVGAGRLMARLAGGLLVDWRRALAGSAATAATAGLWVAAVMAVSSGSLGARRAIDVGPDPLACAGTAAGLVLVGAVLAAMTVRDRSDAQGETRRF